MDRISRYSVVIGVVAQVVCWINNLLLEVGAYASSSMLELHNRDDPHPFFDTMEKITSASQLVTFILNSHSRYRCIQNFRLSPPLFLKLCSLIDQELHKTKSLPTIVQVAVFLDWIAHNSKYRQQKERFKISHELIENCRVNVAKAILKVIYPKYVKYTDSIPDLSEHPKFKRFQGVFGCIDGSHIPIIVPASKHSQWLNRKSFTSTNALLVCDTKNMLFQYALFGAEGCGSDSTIFKQSAQNMKWLENGYLLADAGYGLSNKLLTPYRGVRYHLQEFARSNEKRPKNAKELFNLRHSSLRIIIERCFGVMKNRFEILSSPMVMSSPIKMWRVMYACVALHNFIRIEDNSIDTYFEAVTDEQLRNAPIPETETLTFGSTKAAKRKRDLIAIDMWNDYKEEKRRRSE
jgi:hypothetical protein